MDINKLIKNRRISTPEVTKARFFHSVKKTKSCWFWTGSKLPSGYGSIRATWTGKRTMWRTHRYSWFIHFGDIPKDMCVLHKCDNPSCVNPKHLFLGTQIDNIIDMQKKGRVVAPKGDNHWTRINPENILRGEKHGMSRLTDIQVSEIRENKESLTKQLLAKKYSVCLATIWNVENNKTHASI